MSKEVAGGKAGYLLVFFVSTVSVILVILLTAFMYFLQSGMKVYQVALNDSSVIISAYNLLYYDMAKGRYKTGAGNNSIFYAQNWQQDSGNKYSVIYKIPIDLSDSPITTPCSAYGLNGGDCISNDQGNFVRWQKVKVIIEWDGSGKRYKVTMKDDGFIS